MNLKRLWVIFKSRNCEYFRDRSALGWNFIFPFLIIGGFSLIFGGKSVAGYKIGVFPHPAGAVTAEIPDLPERFRPGHPENGKYLKFLGFPTFEEGMDRLKTHKIDLLLKIAPPPRRYWVDDSSPKGYVAEKILVSALSPPGPDQAVKNEIGAFGIRYLDWLLPGILAMNMMFSALYGVGYVTVRYRKNGTLKRLKATPLTAFEYLAAQTLSRIFVLMFSFSIMFAGVACLFSIQVRGSWALVFVTFLLGSMSLSSVGLIVAARGTSEEFTNGVVNLIAWPMMFLSEVWFSLDGAPEWLRAFSRLFPLTHVLSAARDVMNHGAGFSHIVPELGILVAMTLVFLSIGAFLFSWNE
ncbi:Transport permease protein [Candidatus Desulfarcum epimagneticum]|uniref:Transport permease protein n=1 Tax=uncultured Desulfobacteraceae bacterium TaxID=218296 RepID=A0A484HKK5_9BACT|nr:Transport permease protein [uncultured Desulfobacteraceae bacterium]